MVSNNKKRISTNNKIKKAEENNNESLKIESELDKIDKKLEEIKEKELDNNDLDTKEDEKKEVQEENYYDENNIKELEEDIENEFIENEIEDKIEDEENNLNMRVISNNDLKKLKEQYDDELDADTDILDDIPKKIKREEEKKFSKIITIIISLIIVAFLSYFVYNKYIKVTSINNSDNDIVLSESQIKEIGRQKFQFLNSKHDIKTSYPIFFKDSDVTIDNIDADQILSVAYNLLSVEDKNYLGNENNNCYLDENGITIVNYPEKCHKESFSVNVLKEKLNTYFSNKFNIYYKEFSPTGNLYCTVNDNKYTCYLKHNEIEGTNLQILTTYDTSTLENDKLYIYSYLLTVKRDIYSYKDDEKGIYSDINATNKIDDLNYYNEIMQKGLNEDIIKELLEHYKDKITKYKSVFQKEEGNYVWLGTYID